MEADRSEGAGRAEPVTRGERRRLPRWSELSPLLQMQPRESDPVARRLARAHTIGDLEAIARRRVPRSVFDYVAGAAEGEVSLERSRDAYRRVEFLPQALLDVSTVDLTTRLLGRPSALPLVLAPTGFTRMMQHEGEPAVARAAQAAGIPYALSTMGTTSPAGVAAAAPGGDHWFQLYLWRDREASRQLVHQALAAGFGTLVLTVDTAVPGNRLRDTRNGLTVPPTLRARTLADMSRHPAWWFNLLTTRPLEFAALTSFDGTVAELVDRMFDPSLDLSDLEWLRRAWPGSLVVKGVLTAADAVRMADAGADAVVLSNHGGRQLDRAPTPLELLPEVVAAVGDRVEVYVDTGITNGGDIAAAVGLGATGCLVGRAYLYGLMAGGQAGVAHAVAILTAELRRTMQLVGARSLEELAGRVRLRGEGVRG
ncbi:MAG: alpha-hydroxy acid oxidase [Lapillicoccus sp.]